MLNLGTIKNLGRFFTKSDECGPFHDSLEALKFATESIVDSHYVLAQMPVAARRHAKSCTTCMGAVGDFLAVRNLLLRSLPKLLLRLPQGFPPGSLRLSWLRREK